MATVPRKKLKIRVTQKLLKEENTMSGGSNCGNGCASGSDTASSNFPGLATSSK